MHFVLLPYVLLSDNNHALAFSLLIFTLGITIIITIFRIRKVMQGTKVSVKKTIIFSVYYIAIAYFLVYNSFLIGNVPFVYVIPYSAVVIAAGYGSYRYSKRILYFWKLSTNGDESSSAIYSKGGLAIYLLYIAALIVRSAINFIFIGSEKFYFNNQQEAILENGSSAILVMSPLVHTDPATTILAFTATDFLLMVGAGLLIGRNARVLKYYYQDKKSNA
ncbi:MAG: hypothetical protein JO297_17830 [Nitrososphaeraceae archaeon]|nr:hypothetical protein [Nitrososphaeraceae archaeon]